MYHPLLESTGTAYSGIRIYTWANTYTHNSKKEKDGMFSSMRKVKIVKMLEVSGKDVTHDIKY